MSTVLVWTPRDCREQLVCCQTDKPSGVILETYLEDGGGVVVDGIDTRSVLPEEEHASQEQTVAEERPGAKSLEGLPESHTNGGPLFLDSIVNGGDLLSDIDVTRGQLTDPAKVVHGLRALVVQEQPSGGFPHPERAEQQHTGGDQLDSEGNNPLLVVIRNMLLNTVLDNQVISDEVLERKISRPIKG